MKDRELRGLILQYFYDRRRKDRLPAPKPADLDVDVDDQDILQVCDQLRDHNLLNWHSVHIPSMTIDSWGKGKGVACSLGSINTFGIDVVESAENGIDVIEGTVNSSIKVTFVQHNNNTVTITESTNVNSMIGSNNNNTALTLSELVKAVESADVSPQEKEEAKSLLRKALENPTIAAIMGGSVSPLLNFLS